MKRILSSILLASLFVLRCDAQKIIEKHMSFSNKDLISLDIQIADSIRIITWNKNEVYVKSSININENKDNERYQMTFDDAGSTVKVLAKFREREGNGQGNYNNGCCCFESHIYCDIYMPENANVSVETINGNIVITGHTAAIRAKTISGFIDLSIDAARKADLHLNTISGTVYTDLAVNTNRSSRSVGTKISDIVNGGGKPISLETISGDIFLRKSE
jgi:hypothetical protein